MNILQRWLAKPQEPKPETFATTAGNMPRYFDEQSRDEQLMRKWQRIYVQGGIVSQAIDLYALMILRRGWSLIGGDAEVKLVEAELKRLNAHDIFWYSITRCLTYGFSLCEIVPPARGHGVARIVKRWPGMFRIKVDPYGDIQAFAQVMHNGQESPIDPDRMFYLVLIPSDDEYGISIVQRAYDDIIRDVRTITGLAKAIERHGTGKHWHKLGDETHPSTQADVRAYKANLKEIREDSEIVTTHTVSITDMDREGIPNAQQYSDLTLQRLVGALGVPGELLGLRVGTTDNTAVSRIDAFYDQIQTYQAALAGAVNRQIIDRITGRPGAVVIEFNDPSPRDEATRAAWVTQLMNANKLDPLWIGEEWIREQFGLPEVTT